MAESSTTSEKAPDSKVAAVATTTAVREPTVEEVRLAGSQPMGLEPDGDVVAMVSRDVNGHPNQSENFVVMVPEGVSDAERDAHWNRAGEAQGAKHLSGGGREEATDSRSDGLTDDERQERAEVEHRELYRHNFREDLKA